MSRSKILPASLVVVSVSALLSLNASVAESVADECRAKPGASGPQGTHWRYRVSRSDHRRCWFLNVEAVKVHVRPRAAASDLASSRSASRRDSPAEAAAATPRPVSGHAVPMPAAAADAPTATGSASRAEAAPAGPLVGDDEAVTLFSARWPDSSKFWDFDVLELAATPSSYAEWYSATSADEPMPQVWPVTEVRRPRSAVDIAGEIAWRPTFQIGMLLVTLLVIAGVAFKLVLRFRQSRPLDPRLMPDEMPVQRTTVRGLGDRNSGAGARHDRDALPPITPTDPARDLKKSLAELMADLRRARTPPYSPRSFAPRKLSAIYQKSRSARDLLPPIDGWGEARAGVAAPAEKKRHWSAPVRAHALSDLPETSLSAGPSLVPA